MSNLISEQFNYDDADFQPPKDIRSNDTCATDTIATDIGAIYIFHISATIVSANYMRGTEKGANGINVT